MLNNVFIVKYIILWIVYNIDCIKLCVLKILCFVMMYFFLIVMLGSKIVLMVMVYILLIFKVYMLNNVFS